MLEHQFLSVKIVNDVVESLLFLLAYCIFMGITFGIELIKIKKIRKFSANNQYSIQIFYYLCHPKFDRLCQK